MTENGFKMKIAVSTNNGGLEDEVCPVFGRCMKYTLVECEGKDVKKTEVKENPGFASGGGAGIQAAQFVVNEGVKAVVSGNFGPNSAAVLKQAGVEMIQFQGKVADALQKYLDGELMPLEAPTVRDHFGRCRRGFGGGRGGRGGECR